ncbi:MAG: hypothetical protein LBK60_04275 [Verrucomicrobiales bacterium]|jgi:hypothetical protein|nr:hypothetical protein [Verrucomicrobiales bacterium]
MQVKRKILSPAWVANGIPSATRSAVFAKTNVPNLYRHRNGIYYSRLSLDGRRQFRSLGSDLKSVAAGELKRLKQLSHGQRLVGQVTGSDENLRTFGDCLRLYQERVAAQPNRSLSTVRFKLIGAKALGRTWPLPMTHTTARHRARRCLSVAENYGDRQRIHSSRREKILMQTRGKII